MAINAMIPLQAARKRRDPMRTYANALAIKQAQGQIEAQRAGAARNADMRNALAGAVGPDGQVDYRKAEAVLAQHGDIKNALAVGKGISDRKSAATKSQTDELKLVGERIDLTAQLLGSARDEPSYQNALRQAQQFGLPTEGAPPNFDPQWVSNALQQALSVKERLSHQLSIDKFSETKRHNRATEAKNSGIALSVGPDGTVSFAQGGAGPIRIKPDKTVARNAQKGIVSGMSTLARLNRIKRQYDPAMFTFQGRAQAGIAGIADKLGAASPEQRSLIKRRRALFQNIDREFNAYRKDITGAAAAIQELEALKNATINTDLSPAEFEAAFDEYYAEVARSIRLKRRLLREGISVGDPNFGTKLDIMFFEGSDDDAIARGEELEAAGKSDQEIVNTLTAEGYEMGEAAQ